MNDPALSELLTRVRSAPDHGSPDRNMVAAENLSAAASDEVAQYAASLSSRGAMGIFTDYDGCDSAKDPTSEEMSDVHARHREIVAEARRRVGYFIDLLDGTNKGTPRTRLPWSNDHA